MFVDYQNCLSLEFEEFRGFKILADALWLFLSALMCLSYLKGADVHCLMIILANAKSFFSR